MSNSSKSSTCTMVCWALAILCGLIALWLAWGKVNTLVLILLAIALALFVGLVLTRLFCCASTAASAAVGAGAAATAAATAVAASPKPAPKTAAKKPAAKKAAAKPAAKAASKSKSVGTKPKTMKAARGGKADDLKLIKGVGPQMEKLCNKLGFYHFDQVAAWTKDEVAWVDENLEGFKGRVSRDKWVPQAKTLAKGGQTAFSKKQAKK